MTKAVIVVMLYIIHSYFKTFFIPLFDIFVGQKCVGDFIHTPVTENW